MIAVRKINVDGAVVEAQIDASLSAKAAASAVGGGVVLVPTSYSDPRAFPSTRWCRGASEALAVSSACASSESGAACATSSRAERLRALEDDELVGSAFAARPPRSPSILLCVPRDANARFLVERGATAGGGLSHMGYRGEVSQRPPFSVIELRRIATIENEARISPAWQVLFASIEATSVKWSSQYGIVEWMDACTELQFQLVARALVAGLGCGRSSEDAEVTAGLFSCAPEELAAAVRDAVGETRSAAARAALNGPLDAKLVARGVSQLQTGGHTDPSGVGQISLYWKYNRVAPCRLRAGDAAPDATLTRLDGSRVRFHELVAGAAPKRLVVVGGSYS